MHASCGQTQDLIVIPQVVNSLTSELEGVNLLFKTKQKIFEAI